jgi:predicted F0F1-ATPase subunit
MTKKRLSLLLGDASQDTRIVSEEETKIKKNSDTWKYLGAVGDIGFTIAIPIVLGAMTGKYIDTSFGTDPAGVLVFLFLGIVISVVGFIFKIKDIVEMDSYKK